MNEDHISQGEDLRQQIPRMISNEDNESLNQFPSTEEIKISVDEMDNKSLAGPDGFNGFFYKTCWDIIKIDFCDVLTIFFARFVPPKAWTSTLIIPLPKFDHQTELKQLRPISLCNFYSKVISMVLSNKLSPFLQKNNFPRVEWRYEGKIDSW